MTAAVPERSVDVAVVGGGACGMMAALRIAAGDPSLEVAVFEKSTQLGCNTEIASGTLAAAGTRFQAAAGIEDSPERHAADILTKNKGAADPDITRELCVAARNYVEWLSDEVGHELTFDPSMTRDGHSAPRLHQDSGRAGGSVLVERMRRAVADGPSIDFHDETPAVGLLEDDGAVTGVVVEHGGQSTRVRAGATVLACDGFGANRELVARHCPAMATALYVGVAGNTGEALTWAVRAGAATDHMSAYQGHGYVVPRAGARLDPAIPLRGGIVVNEEGRRFVAEDQGYSEFAQHVLAQPRGQGVEIWDERIHGIVAHSVVMRQAATLCAFERAASVDELAERFELPAAALAATLRDYDAAVSGGTDPLGRRRLPEEPLTPPYYAGRITGALAHTQGGLRVDAQGRVQRRSGGAIPGLYAGGGTAAGVSGDAPEGYLSGNGLLASLGFAWLIAEAIVGGRVAA